MLGYSQLLVLVQENQSLPLVLNFRRRGRFNSKGNIAFNLSGVPPATVAVSGCLWRGFFVEELFLQAPNLLNSIAGAAEAEAHAILEQIFVTRLPLFLYRL